MLKRRFRVIRSAPVVAATSLAEPNTVPAGPVEPIIAPAGLSEPNIAPAGLSEPNIAPAGLSEPIIAPVGLSEPIIAPIGLSEALSAKRPRLADATSSSYDSDSDSDSGPGPNAVESDEFLRANHLTKMLSVSKHTLRRWANANMIRVERVGVQGVRAYNVADVQRVLGRRKPRTQTRQLAAYTSVAPLGEAGDDYLEARRAQGELALDRAVRRIDARLEPSCFVDVVDETTAWDARTQYWRLFTEVLEKRVTVVYVDSPAFTRDVFEYQASLFAELGAKLIDVSDRGE